MHKISLVIASLFLSPLAFAHNGAIDKEGYHECTSEDVASRQCKEGFHKHASKQNRNLMMNQGENNWYSQIDLVSRKINPGPIVKSDVNAEDNPKKVASNTSEGSFCTGELCNKLASVYSSRSDMTVAAMGVLYKLVISHDNSYFYIVTNQRYSGEDLMVIANHIKITDNLMFFLPGDTTLETGVLTPQNDDFSHPSVIPRDEGLLKTEPFAKLERGKLIFL